MRDLILRLTTPEGDTLGDVPFTAARVAGPGEVEGPAYGIKPIMDSVRNALRDLLEREQLASAVDELDLQILLGRALLSGEGTGPLIITLPVQLPGQPVLPLSQVQLAPRAPEPKLPTPPAPEPRRGPDAGRRSPGQTKGWNERTLAAESRLPEPPPNAQGSNPGTGGADPLLDDLFDFDDLELIAEDPGLDDGPEDRVSRNPSGRKRQKGGRDA